MPKGHLAGVKRPRDPAQLAKLMIDIASGEVEDREPTPEEQGKNAAAVRHGQAGGLKRAQTVTPKKRSEIAKKAARARWQKDRVPRATKEPA
jgi:hypothetical protein